MAKEQLFAWEWGLHGANTQAEESTRLPSGPDTGVKKGEEQVGAGWGTFRCEGHRLSPWGLLTAIGNIPTPESVI